MKTSIGDLLPAWLPELPALLAGAGARERLIAPGVAALPLLSGLLLECWLGEGAADAPVGLALRAAAASDFAAVAEAAGEGGEAWRTVGDLARKLSEDESWREAFPELWLEFDLDAAPPASALEAPSVFVQVSETLGRPPRLGAEVPARREQSVKSLCALLERLGANFSGSGEALARVLEAMPASTRISYLGVMLARGQKGCRLTFDRMPLDGGCTALLRALGGLADEGAVVAAIETLAGWTPHAVLHLDLDAPTGRLGPVLGFELEPALLANESARAELLSRRLVTCPQLEALARWPQRRHRATDGGDWPAALTHVNYFSRTLNHLKLVLATDAPCPARWELKAYLGASWGQAFPVPALWK
jgi:hypothetical protein